LAETDPADSITFTVNKFMEAALAGTMLKDHIHHCVVCERENRPETHIEANGSVLLSCDCMVAMCQPCALRRIAREPDTYSDGITCPVCNHRNKKAFGGVCGKRRAPTVLADVDCSCEVCYLSTCEKALVQSAKDYCTDKLSPHGKYNDRDLYRKLCDMLRLYWCLGYVGEFTEDCLNGKNAGRGQFNGVAADSVKPTEWQLRLEIARLEELRLNSCGAARTYDILSELGHTVNLRDLPLGFLQGALAHRDPVFEHAFLGYGKEDIPGKGHRVEVRNKVSEAIKAAQSACLEQQELRALDKIALVALHTHRAIGDPAQQYPFSSSEDVVRAVHAVLMQLAKPHRGVNKPFVDRICKPLTVPVIARVMQGLVSNGYITNMWDLTKVRE
jgi:hypothetical protein